MRQPNAEELAKMHRDERARRFAEALVAFQAINSHDRADFFRIARALDRDSAERVEGLEAKFERKMAQYASELAAQLKEAQA